MNYGDIILIEHTTTDQHQVKIRPAVVISSDSYNVHEDDRIIIPISSNTTRNCPYDIEITNQDSAFASSGLKVSSVVRIGKIYTLHKKLTKRILGHLPPEKLQEINDIIKQLLNIR